MTIDDLTLAIVLGAAAIDSINPCAIGVMLFLTSVLLRSSAPRRSLLQLGSIYVATVYLVYVASGLGLVWFQHTLIQSGFAETVGIVVGSLVILMGLIELKDAFWYGKGISLEIPDRYRQRLVKLAGRVSVVGMISVGAFVAAVELPCTGGPYLAITALLAKSFDLTALLYLLLYNVVRLLTFLFSALTDRPHDLLRRIDLENETVAPAQSEADESLAGLADGGARRLPHRVLRTGLAPMTRATRAVFGGLLLALLGCERSDTGEGRPPPEREASTTEDLAALAQCLSERGWVVYSSSTCSACWAQREAFGAAFSSIDEIECNPHAPGADTERCLKRKVRKTPTWIAEPAGEEADRLEGYQRLEVLAKRSGCPF